LPREEAIAQIKYSIEKSYTKKGKAVVEKNFKAVDATLENLYEVTVPEKATVAAVKMQIVSDKAPEFVRNVIAPMLAGHGDNLPVSAISNDGTWPSATTQWEKRNVSDLVAIWNPESCIQCGN
jgi:pyruvate-ferredoxin/flavodoxin oxidoreductase